MPTYGWECPVCGAYQEVICRIADRNDAPKCPCQSARETLQAMTRVIEPPMVMGDAPPYRAVTGDKMGQEISGRVQHREFLKRNRLVEVGDAPVRPTNIMRPTVKKGSIRRELKRAIAEHTVPDMQRGGLRERRGR